VFIFIPATRIVTGPPPLALGCCQVLSPYVVSGPNWTLTFAVAGALIVYEATWTFAVGVTTPLATTLTDAFADFVASAVLVAVIVAVAFVAVAGAV
jgi:ABC-type maltose transport system permease subunit